MKKLFFTFALVAGFMTAQAQDDSKSTSGDTQTQPKTETSPTKKSDEKMDKSSDDAKSTSGAGTTTDTTLSAPTTPVDTTRRDRKPEEE
jgi:hypothetical protein